MTNQTYINQARENVSLYNCAGDNLGIVELQDTMAVLLGKRYGTPELCARLSSMGVRNLVNLTVNELQEEGLSENKAVELQAAFLLAKKLQINVSTEQRYKIRSPEDAANYVMADLMDLKQEHFVALFLNVKNEVIAKKTLFIGSLNSSIVHPRELFKEALKHSAASSIIFHNHPSGDVSPSSEDIEVTKRVMECGIMMGIDILDHIIIGNNKFLSLKDKGYI